jgi:hypothetical protein
MHRVTKNQWKHTQALSAWTHLQPRAQVILIFKCLQKMSSSQAEITRS